MKKYITLILVLIAALCCVMSASAEKVIFTCDSDPVDFNGKTFDDLYVLLNGCTNFDSTIIPGEEAFVTLRDITVYGELFYVDDTYDRSTDTYRDAVMGEQLTTTDHWLNVAGESKINLLNIECIDPHVCNLGLQNPTIVLEMNITGNTGIEKPRVVIRGYIDPLVDEKTDYYKDSYLASYPDFDIKEFDYTLSKIAASDINKFDFLNAMYAAFFETTAPYPYSLSWMEEYQELTDEETLLFTRAFINEIEIHNSYGVSAGNLNVDFINIEIGNIGLDNRNIFGPFIGNEWTPVIRSGGFTNVGRLVTDSNFKTDVVVNNNHNINAVDEDNFVLPMFIDYLVIGSNGHEVTYDMHNTRISMLDYLGDELDGSKFTLNTDANGNTYNMNSIGIMNVMGGALSMSGITASASNPVVENLNFYESNPDFMYSSYTDSEWAIRHMDDLYDSENTYLYSWDPVNRTIETAHKTVRDRRSDIYDTKLMGLNNFPRTGYGYFMITRSMDEYLKTGDADVSNTSKVSFYGQNVSLGDINVSNNLGDITTWMDGSCNFWQHGKQQMIVSKITK